ncbi:MAG: SAM hydrolase/SAM-dependent halogenase family protein [Thermoprotei archaeon]
MRSIAILTDFGTSDVYNGIMEGVIRNLCPEARVNYLSPDVRSWSLYSGTYLLFSSYKYYPKNTVFLVVVDPGVGTRRRAIVVKTKNYIFVGPDNGVLYPAVSEDGIVEAYEITNRRLFLSKEISYTFHGRDIFSPVAALLACKVKPNVVGSRIDPDQLVKLNLTEHYVEGSRLRARVVHIDKFGNVALSVRPRSLVLGERAKVTVKEKSFVALTARTFGEVVKGERLLYINSFGFLEIATNQGNLAEELGVSEGDEACIEPYSLVDSNRYT